MEARAKDLTRELSQAREQRLQAQKQIARTPLLRAAMARVSRDRSTLTTSAIEDMRQVSQRRADEIAEHADAVDGVRQMLANVRASYPDVEVPPRLTSAIKAEAEWRNTVSADERSTTYRIRLPRTHGAHDDDAGGE